MNGVTKDSIRVVADALKKLNKPVVFVGGAVAVFYNDGLNSEKVRYTKDVDVVLEILSLAELEKIRQGLVDSGFKHVSESPVLCRFSYQNILVDVMSVKGIGWAPGNHWFETGFSKAEKHLIEDTEILLLPLPYYLATKFSAFLDRGIKDPFLSHDLEDIIYVLDNNANFADKLSKCKDMEVTDFLKTNMKQLMDNSKLKEAVIGHLSFHFQKQRIQQIQKNITLFCR